MRKLRVSITLVAALLIIATGCGRSRRAREASHDRRRHAPTSPARRVVFTADNNPTTLAGRGQPSLDDAFRPAAWIHVDDKGGKYIEREGSPQVQWIIEDPVGPSPTFRVEVYEPLLGKAADFNCLIDTVESADGSKISYALAADRGTFEMGRAYPLLRPGDTFVIRNRATGDVVKEIAPLAPGKYLIVAGVKNLDMGREALTVTHFTVEARATK